MATAAGQALAPILDPLLARYRERVPDVQRVVDLMLARGMVASPAAIENDHIAFRTLGAGSLGIASIERIFTHYGYRPRDEYRFADKKLDARWFAPPDDTLPRIFVSELRVRDLSAVAQRILERAVAQADHAAIAALDLDDAHAIDAFFATRHWDVPAYDDYRLLADESEYAAWTIVHGYALNHLTIGLRALAAGFRTCEAFDAVLRADGIRLNSAGGEVKRSPDGLLLQSSTVAAMVDVTFAGGDVHPVAGAYIEFAERRPLPAFAHLAPDALRREHLRDGFEASNADKIFESTFRNQTGAAS